MTEFLKNLISCVLALTKSLLTCRTLCPLFVAGFLLEVLFVHVGYRTAKGKNTEEKKTIKIKKPNYIKMLFYDLPKNIGADIARRNPNEFKEFGCILFEGEQGAGKTSSMVKYAKDLQAKYPKSKILSNIAIKEQEVAIETPKDFLKHDNDIYGDIIVIDEVQNFWNSKNSLNLDASITQFITTQRKTRRLMLATAQKFYMLSKDIRCNTKEVRTCRCIAGNLNIVICKKPIFDSMGEIKKYKFKKIYMFLQDEELRNSYDTREIVKYLSKNGLKVKTERE